MIPMYLGDVAAAVGAPSDPIIAQTLIRRVTTDSRDVQPGDLLDRKSVV